MHRDSSGVVHPPERSWLQQLWRGMQQWQGVLNEQSNQFSGDVLLSRQEDLKNITTLVGRRRGVREEGLLRSCVCFYVHRLRTGLKSLHKSFLGMRREVLPTIKRKALPTNKMTMPTNKMTTLTVRSKRR